MLHFLRSGIPESYKLQAIIKKPWEFGKKQKVEHSPPNLFLDSAVTL